MSTTRERILDAAIACFGRQGFDVGLREIGSEAGFSAALIVRQFGSKDALREECDAEVAAQIKQIKGDSMAAQDSSTVMAQLAHVEEYAEILGYVVHSLLAGGQLAQHFVEQMIDDAVDYFAQGERAGLIRPSRDPRARARYMAYSGLGAMLMQLRFERTDTEDLSALVRDVLDRQLMPAAELYTYGFFTDTSILEGMLAAGYGADTNHPEVPDPSERTDRSGAAGHTSPTSTPPSAEGDPQ